MNEHLYMEQIAKCIIIDLPCHLNHVHKYNSI